MPVHSGGMRHNRTAYHCLVASRPTGRSRITAGCQPRHELFYETINPRSSTRAVHPILAMHVSGREESGSQWVP